MIFEYCVVNECANPILVVGEKKYNELFDVPIPVVVVNPKVDKPT